MDAYGRYVQIMEKILAIPRFTTKNPLSHTRRLLRELGNPQDQFKIIHVAGSNGKGSVCAYIASVLQAAGKRTGLFTSPHLVHMEERFQVSRNQSSHYRYLHDMEWEMQADALFHPHGCEEFAREAEEVENPVDVRLHPCSREEFVRAAEEVERAVAALEQEGLPHPTFFEYIFAMGMLVFAWNQVEYAVLETGLGGRLDATNIVERPLLTVITSISLEHTEILGDTIGQIAAEKAGILKAGVPVVYDASDIEANMVILEHAHKLGCPCYPVNPKKIKIFLNTGKKIDFSYDSGYDVTEVEIPFGAPYQAQNASVALQALACLAQTEGISKEAIQAGMAHVEWKGRMQEVQPKVYLDGAHNMAGIEKFLEAVEHITEDSAVLLFSMVKEKDYAHAARRLLEKGRWEEIIVTSVPGSRGVRSQVLAEAFHRCLEGAPQEPSPGRDAEKGILQAGSGNLGTGSDPKGRTENRISQSVRAVKITEIEEIDAAFTYAKKIQKQGQALFCAGSLYLIGELERIAGGMQND